MAITHTEMPSLEDILFINNESDFIEKALDIFSFQARHCRPYMEYMSLLGIRPDDINTVEKITFIPIELFKSHKVYCGSSEPEVVFSSSTTTGAVPSRHYVAFEEDYVKTFRKAFTMFYGIPKQIHIYALLPGYIERKGSSLIYMIDNLIRSGKGGGFYLDDHEGLLRDIDSDPGSKILFGVSHALLNLAEKYSVPFEKTIIMETGGMKGRREELPKKEFYRVLSDSFKAGDIHSEYGMAELSSQAYSSGKNVFRTPPWMKIFIRDLNDPFDILHPGRTGGINIIDLANRYSCAFIQTQDLGMVNPDGSFEIHGRIDKSEIRGCNLLV